MNKFGYCQMPIRFLMRWSLFFPFVNTSFIYFIPLFLGGGWNLLAMLISKLFWCFFPVYTLMPVNSSSYFGLLPVFLSVSYRWTLQVEMCFLPFLSPLPSIFCLYLVLTFLSRFRACPGSARLPVYGDTDGLDGEKLGLGPKPSSLWLHCQKPAEVSAFWLLCRARWEYLTPVLDTESCSSPPSGMKCFFEKNGPAFVSDSLAPAVHCGSLCLYVSRPWEWLPCHFNLFQWLCLDQDREFREELSNFSTFPCLI